MDYKLVLHGITRARFFGNVWGRMYHFTWLSPQDNKQRVFYMTAEYMVYTDNARPIPPDDVISAAKNIVKEKWDEM